ncbi:unnamed protein product [Aspergillus oryzae]|nr:unnamed protein product [Aspergillus oryzae]
MYFSEEGEPNQDRDIRSWDNRFDAHIQLPRQKAGITEFDLEEKIAVIDMLQSMLSFKPEARPTAQDYTLGADSFKPEIIFNYNVRSSVDQAQPQCPVGGVRRILLIRTGLGRKCEFNGENAFADPSSGSEAEVGVTQFSLAAKNGSSFVVI